jgi:hypothetical protein
MYINTQKYKSKARLECLEIRIHHQPSLKMFGKSNRSNAITKEALAAPHRISQFASKNTTTHPKALKKSFFTTQSRRRRINFSLSSSGESDAFLVFQPQ